MKADTAPLKEYLKSLSECCRDNPEWRWPEHSDYGKLTRAIQALYRAEIAPKRRAVVFWDAVQAVDHRWAGLKLVSTITRLIDRVVTAIPAGPITKLVQKKNTPGISQEEVTRIDKLCVMLRNHDAQSTYSKLDWSLYYPLLEPLTTMDFRAGVARPKNVQESEHYRFIREQMNMVGWAAFVDVQRQSLLWLRKYERDMMPFAQWVVGLRNDDLSAKLKPLLYGEVIQENEYRELHGKLLAKARQTNARARKSAKKRDHLKRA